MLLDLVESKLPRGPLRWNSLFNRPVKCSSTKNACSALQNRAFSSNISSKIDRAVFALSYMTRSCRKSFRNSIIWKEIALTLNSSCQFWQKLWQTVSFRKLSFSHNNVQRHASRLKQCTFSFNSYEKCLCIGLHAWMCRKHALTFEFSGMMQWTMLIGRYI